MPTAAKKTKTAKGAKNAKKQKLVIVESPAKAKTIKKYLGSGYEVVASMGHVRDLPKTTLGVDIENHFTPKYTVMRGKGDIVKQLKSSAKKSDKVFLATDPDREGEGISWHLAYLLGLDIHDTNRVTFNEITKTGVKNGMSNPRQIDLDLVNAYQARRVLDRIVGYKLSPLLWKKVRAGLSAGRVQSVSVRMIVDREEEIQNFIPKEYWSIEALLALQEDKKAAPFLSKFYGIGDKKLEIENKQQADELLEEIKKKPFIVAEVKKGTKKRSPAPPFITSTLQQEASTKLGFQAKRTMKAAQELYEGVTIKGVGAMGLITYMRTDSLRISQEAQDAALEFIGQQWGQEYLPAKPRVYKSKKGSQDGHEAIRPSVPSLTPQQAKESLTGDQYKLYKLVWERFVASQMADAVYNTVTASIDAGKYRFKSSGSSVKFAGFTALYDINRDEEGKMLPALEKGMVLDVNKLRALQHFTQPPARFTEASLIKTLEENGIGRPSTYAPTIMTILSRGYIEREGKSLKPTQLGEITTKLMKENFANIVDAEFTAHMEQDLDEVEEGKVSWEENLAEFYQDFEKELQQAEKNLEGVSYKVPDEETDIVCEKCGRNMVIKMGRFGKFLACPGYPECKNTKRIVQESGGVCPLCGGKILVKKSKKGKAFYGCEHNPECGFMTWDQPTGENCPKCGSSLLQKKGRGAKIYCSNEKCDYERGVKVE